MKKQITVVGLGSGSPDQLTLGVWKLLQKADHLYVRTKHHPMMTLLDEEQLAYTSFDDVYERHANFPDVYEEIVQLLIEKVEFLAESEGTAHVVYAVPGHPMVAESTVQQLLSRCELAGIELDVRGGESFLDAAFTALRFDPIEGFALLDAAALSPAQLQPQLHIIIGQVYDQYTASDVKLALMERYPDEYEVIVGHALGIEGQEQILHVPIYELDRMEGYHNLSVIYVPRSTDDALRNRTFERLHEIVAILRSPGGCPWDMEQTHQSIRKNFIEELYEALEALDNDDPQAMQEEFGDVLLQLMLHSQMEEELGSFSMFDVIQTLNEKLVYRHPHVFGEQSASNAEDALKSWEAMKQKEQEEKGIAEKRPSKLDGIPKDLPALLTAYKLQKKAAKVGFDWDDIGPVLDKIVEELEELKKELESGDQDKQAAELGDLLFAVVNASRFIGADPEEALARTNLKFKTRFQYIEEQLRINGKSFDNTNLVEMDHWWDQAKKFNGKD
ncbi:nucleoside triphosphate pyrophosphohydrolase [Paenibacillus septentrionalis]|uniref:Nucleoside triphosphate pyrophosphohydrolase n=1 Tax=Paenibacillus septentrionalis TaxID=429342 RepID=A0ABW1VBL4_9BACL